MIRPYGSLTDTLSSSLLWVEILIPKTNFHKLILEQ